MYNFNKKVTKGIGKVVLDLHGVFKVVIMLAKVSIDC